VGFECGRARHAGLAAGQPDLDDLAVREQRQAAGGLGQARPVEAAVGLQHVALGVTQPAGDAANRVLGLE
jgi:hypothetical protein